MSVITHAPKEELIATGSRLRAPYLVEQAGYTLAIAALGGPPLAHLLPADYLAALRDMVGQVQVGMQDRALIAAEAKDATVDQNLFFSKTKIWCRKTARRAARAQRLGHSIPKGLLTFASARTGPALMTRLTEMVKLLESNLANLHGAGLDELLAEGKALMASLGAADAKQEQKRFKELPDAEAASRYNLASKYRRLGDEAAPMLGVTEDLWDEAQAEARGAGLPDDEDENEIRAAISRLTDAREIRLALSAFERLKRGHGDGATAMAVAS